jgi:hypothetical protein
MRSINKPRSIKVESKSQSYSDTEIKMLNALRSDYSEQPYTVPPEGVWEKIKETNWKVQDKSVFEKYKLERFFKIAASVCIFSAAGMMWTNHQLKNELNNALKENRILEEQLAQRGMPTYRQSQLLSQVRIIELKLGEAKSSSEKISLLRKRQNVMKRMVNNIKGDNYEYSI